MNDQIPASAEPPSGTPPEETDQFVHDPVGMLDRLHAIVMKLAAHHKAVTGEDIT